MNLSSRVILAGFLAHTACCASALVTCTKAKNGGDILLYGNADSVGGWTEVYADPNVRRERELLRGRDLVVTAGSTFDLMFEMDCNAPNRTFDFELYNDNASTIPIAEHSFIDQSIEYRHYGPPSYPAIDHSIFDMNPFGPIAEGSYTYTITSKIGADVEASATGTLKSLMDSDSPEFFSITNDATGNSVAPGTVVTFTLGLSDDTVLNYLTVTVNGEYYERKGLKTVGNKISTTMPLEETVVYTIPSKGKIQPYAFNFRACDVTNKCVEDNVTIKVVKEGGGGGKPNKRE